MWQKLEREWIADSWRKCTIQRVSVFDGNYVWITAELRRCGIRAPPLACNIRSEHKRSIPIKYS